MGYDISVQTMSKLYRMVAHVHGQIQNISSLAQALRISSPTVIKYLNLLEGGFLIHRLEPYYVNTGKRLVKSPKIYFRDSGLLHQLSTIPSFEALQGNQLIGASWESYVIEQIRRALDESWQFYYYRTVAGAETDLVIITPGGVMTCVEIKYSIAPVITKGFYQSMEDLKPGHQYIIVPAGAPYFFKEKLKVSNLKDFLEQELIAIL